jgi:UTP-glucose-1-phosphate uridylyltransferase
VSAEHQYCKRLMPAGGTGSDYLPTTKTHGQSSIAVRDDKPLAVNHLASSGISGGFFIERDRDLARRGETGRLS